MLSIDQLAPEWCKFLDRIATNNLNLDQARTLGRSLNLDIGKPDRCVVGEAHDWTSGFFIERYEDFYCPQCSDFAGSMEVFDDFIILYYRMVTETVEDWRQTPFVNEFVEHFNKVHTNKDGKVLSWT